MARERNNKAGDAVDAEASKQSGSGKKTPKPLKPEPKIAKKSPNQSTERNPEKAKNVDRNKEKNSKESDNAPMKNQRDAGNEEKIDGMIFMCNAKTKSDCFRYMVMGLPQSKKDIVATIKPGLKLFLYDFDAKLLYGIYKATSAGGMKLEPAAFSGSYPAQVRFRVHMECSPLSEGSFKKAIMANSDGDKIKFNTELTTQQVKKLTSLFQPSPKLKSNGNPTLHSPQPVHATLRPIPPPPTEASLRPQSRGQKETAPIQKDTVLLDPLSFGEKEYRMFGLRQRAVPAPVPTPIPSSVASDPYAPLTRIHYLSNVDSETDLSRRRMDESEYKRPAAEQLATQPAYYRSYSYGVPRSEAEYGVREAETGRLHSTHAANALSDYTRNHQQPSERGDFESLPVSSRYSFAGPSFPYQ